MVKLYENKLVKNFSLFWTIKTVYQYRKKVKIQQMLFDDGDGSILKIWQFNAVHFSATIVEG